MSNLSAIRGGAFEFACMNSLYQAISEKRKCWVIKDNNYEYREADWKKIGKEQQRMYLLAADCAVRKIFELEPNIEEESNDILEFFFQSDSKGRGGDVRDIVLRRGSISWEIGISIKHNHFAVKHSRLGRKLDFCESWFSIPCTDSYWDDVKPIFEYLAEEKKNESKWRDLPDKENDVYIPLLKAFMDELNRQNEIHGSIVPRRMVEYLLGEFDFYKLVSVDISRVTELTPYNLRGTLNRPSKTKKPAVTIPVTELPDRIVSIDMKPGSDNTVELYLNNGWSFSFRIHNASTNVETSLKFDIQALGVPSSIIKMNCIWC